MDANPMTVIGLNFLGANTLRATVNRKYRKNNVQCPTMTTILEMKSLYAADV